MSHTGLSTGNQEAGFLSLSTTDDEDSSFEFYNCVVLQWLCD